MPVHYQNILWDFDGVIIDSMPIRDLGYEKIFSHFSNDQVSQLMAYHRHNGGLSRFHKIRYFFEQVLHTTITDEEVQTYADRFSELMRQLLCDKSLLIQDSVSYIRRNKEQKRCHLVSASEENELKYLCSQLNIADCFLSIHGSPTTKIDNVKRLIAQWQYPLEATCLIGDSINDQDAAVQNNIRFFGYRSAVLEQDPSVSYIHSFGEK